MKKRLTTDNPQNNIERMLNYAYAKDYCVFLRYGDGKRDIDLCDYISRKAKEHNCDYVQTADDVMDGTCMEMGCDCVLSVIYTVAIQAAELRERLKEYENAKAPKNGEWLNHYLSGTVVKEGFVSSCCDMWNASKTPYCPYCGAKMDESEVEE